MKRTKIAFGLLIAGVGAISSAFTTKLLTNDAGWYSASVRAFQTTSVPTYGTSGVASATFSSNASTNKPLSACQTDEGFVCAIYYNANNINPVTFITGAFIN